MVLSLFLVLAFQLVGEALSRLSPIPVPGPVVGMMLALVAFALSKRLLAQIRPVAQTVLGNLSLLFVPAGVGIVGHTALMRQEGLALLVATAGSTILAMAATAYTFLAVARWQERRREGDDDA